MSAKDDGGPAFPTGTQVEQNGATGETTVHQYLSDGMTLRDYFAARAMQGNIAGWPADQLFNPEGIAGHAYETADAMLKARNQ